MRAWTTALITGLITALLALGSAAEDGASLLATLADEGVTESSGLAASRRTPGLLWTHNDSGGGPLLYTTDRSGRALGRWLVSGAANGDWEDMAVGPGPDGTDALYLADSGDNARRRDDLALYRVPEPTTNLAEVAPSEPPFATAPAERFPFVYPDGPHDAEALLVHPVSGEVVVVTKTSTGPAGVFRFPTPLVPEETVTLLRMTDLALPGFGPARAVTGGAIAPDSSRLVLRTPVAAYEWPLAADGSLADALGAGPTRVALPADLGGEAIAYRADGDALLVTSEGTPCPLYELRRAGRTTG